GVAHVERAADRVPRAAPKTIVGVTDRALEWPRRDHRDAVQVYAARDGIAADEWGESNGERPSHRDPAVDHCREDVDIGERADRGTLTRIDAARMIRETPVAGRIRA